LFFGLIQDTQVPGVHIHRGTLWEIIVLPMHEYVMLYRDCQHSTKALLTIQSPAEPL